MINCQHLNCKTSTSQGLTFHDSKIYEGTGLEHQSHLFQHDPTNQMKTLHKQPLTPSHLFGEGISHYYVWKLADERTGKRRVKEHRLIQLTWKDKVGFVYSLPDMKLIKEFTYDTVTGEGWGITFVEHANEFYVSDGSAYLMVWDVDTLVEKRRVKVTFERGDNVVMDVRYLNELEFVDFAKTRDGSRDDSTTTSGSSEMHEQCIDSEGTACTEDETNNINIFTPTMRILANIWYEDVLVSIDPTSGKVVHIYDLSDIYPIEQRHRDGSDCLNGISVTGERHMFEDVSGGGLEVWVTGKLWPNMYRIRLIG